LAGIKQIIKKKDRRALNNILRQAKNKRDILA